MSTRDHQRAVVLLIEDDPGDQELTRRALIDGPVRAQLHICSDGSEAIDYLGHTGRYTGAIEAPRPDIILLDMNLPGMDGADILKWVRANESLRSVPVVMLTTSDSERDVQRSYQLGCNAFITKPVSVVDFVRVVGSVGRFWFELVTLPNRGASHARPEVRRDS